MPINQYFDFIDEMNTGRTGTPFKGNGERSYKRLFRVITRVKSMGPLDVCCCPGLPLFFSPYQSITGTEYDLLALLVDMTARQDVADDWSMWVVECTYSTIMPPGGAPEDPGSPGSPGSQGQGSQNSPELEPPDIEWDAEEVQRAFHKDLDGKPFTNSSMEPFKPALQLPIGRSVLAITRNEVDFDRQRAIQYANAINDDVFLTTGPGLAQIIGAPKAKLMNRGPLRYWRVSYRIRFAAILPDGTGFETLEYHEVLDEGSRELQDTDPPEGSSSPGKVSVPIITKGVRDRGVLLDGSGHKKEPDASGHIEPHYLKFRVARRKNFTSLLDQGLGSI